MDTICTVPRLWHTNHEQAVSVWCNISSSSLLSVIIIRNISSTSLLSVIIIRNISSASLLSVIIIWNISSASRRCCCLPTPMTLASGGSPMFPLVVHQPASPSIWPAVQSLRRGVHKSRGDNVVRMWMQLKR